MDADQLRKLTAPFPKEALRSREIGKKGSGRWVDYVAGHTVIHRLNDVTGNNWNLEILNITSGEIAQRNGETGEMVRAHVRLTIPGLGSREHVGVQILSAGGGEDLYKGAITDALKKAGTLFGVGLELYGEDYEDESYQPAQARPAARPTQPAPRPAPAPHSAPQAPQRPANVTPLPPPSSETRNTVLEWLTKNNVAPETVLTALGTESMGDWLKTHPGEGWAGLKKTVEDAVFPAPAEASS